MGFSMLKTKGDEFIGEDKDTKQHINLSSNAFYILNCDLSCFTNEANTSSNIPSSFLNKIFQNFYDNAKSTLGISNDTTYKAITEKGTGFNFRLQKETIRILKDCIGDTEKYYCSNDKKNEYVGKYLKAVFEEYALLPYYKREAIYFKQELENIQAAIEMSKIITYTYRDKQHKLKPYTIMLDEWSSYNYIIGLDENDKLINCRLSYVKNVATSFRFDKFSNDTKAKFNELIIKRGVQFVQSEPEKIIVKLTPNGKNMYDHMVFLRPAYKSICQYDDKNYILNFYCTPNQIEYYFFKFGENVIILEPKNLRDKFIKKYKYAATENYIE